MSEHLAMNIKPYETEEHPGRASIWIQCSAAIMIWSLMLFALSWVIYMNDFTPGY